MNYKAPKFSRNKLVLGVASSLLLTLSSNLYAAENKLTLDIDSQSAGTALLALSEASGVQIMIPQNAGSHVQVPSVKGEHSLTDALGLMLQGTGLTYQFSSDELVIIQSSEGSDEGSEGEEVDEVDEEVVVTGTRLKNVSAGSQVISITRDDIKKNGFGSVEDIIRSIPQNYNSVNSATTLDVFRQSRDTQGQAAFDLRGLGSSSTLVLVNGRRWAQSATFRDGTVNLNGIPFSAIERIDVILVGASAIYGSDAQAGVVNFILRKDYSGAETIVRYENSSNAADRYRLEQNLGTNWDSGNITLTVSHTDSDDIDSRKAGYVTDDHRARGGRDSRLTFGGQPGVISGLDFIQLINEGALSFVDYGALPLGDDGTNGLSALEPGNITPFDVAASTFSSGVTESSDTSARLAARQEITDTFSVFAELNYSRQEASSITVFPLIFARATTSPFFTDLPPALQEQQDFADALGGPFPGIFSNLVNVAYLPVQELQDGVLSVPSTDSSADSGVYTLGFNADLPIDNWTSEFAFTTAEEENRFFNGRINLDAVQERVDSGLLNPFGNGETNSPEAYEGLFLSRAEGETVSVFEHDTIDFFVEGPLFSISGGDVRMVAGLEVRDETLDTTEDPPGPFDIDNLITPVVSRDVESVYSELGLPLIGDENSLPGVQQLSLKLAARYDKYSYRGEFNIENGVETRTFSHTSPRVELNWTPVESLNVRFNWGESFRAPTLTQTFIQVAPTSNFEERFNPRTGLFDVVSVETVNNPDLGPELSDTISVGFNWAPDGWLEGFSLDVNYSEIEINGRFLSGREFFALDPATYVEIPYVDPENGEERTLGAFDSDDRFTSLIFLSTVNIAAQSTEVTDITVDYDFDTEVGSFTVGLNGSYVSEVSVQTTPNSRINFTDATTFGPDRVRATGYVNWSQGDMSANVRLNYSSSYAAALPPQERVDNYLTVDVNGTYTFAESRWKLNVGVRNLFDEDFPFFNVRAGAPWDTSRVDPRGRVAYLELSKEFGF